MRPGCYDPKARLADMDMNRTERSLCFPTFPRFAGQTFLEAKDKELALACVRAYNDWMIEEWCGDSGGRLIPLCIVADVGPGARGGRGAAQRGAGLSGRSRSPSCPPTSACRRSTTPTATGTPSSQACDETGTVVCMHIGSGSKYARRTSADAPQGVGTALTSLNAYMSMADWLLSGALVRFPSLKIAFSESQVGWMPFLLERLDTLVT